jgi:hypothetical protein
MRRRNAQSWDSLVARLRPNWNARELIEESPEKSLDGSFANWMSNLTLYEKLKRMQEARGLWNMFENASVMLEMADYAARNGSSFNGELLETLRKEAMQIRILVLEVVGKYAFNAVNESVSANVLRAESAYAEMAMRITELLEVSAPEALPGFVGAM